MIWPRFAALAAILLVTASPGCLTTGDKTPGPTTSGPMMANETAWTDPGTGWTMTTWIVYYDGAANPTSMQPERVLMQKHPNAVGWHTSSAQSFAGNKSWTSADEAKGGYHDFEYAFMVSPTIDLTGFKTANFSFMVKGDAEANGYDGLYWAVRADGTTTWTDIGKTTKTGGTSVAIPDWTPAYGNVDSVVGKKFQIRFLFKSDDTCSKDTDLPSTGTPVQCGPGKYSAYYVAAMKIIGTK